jgi:transposase
MIFMPKQYPRELRERAIRLVIEHRGEYQTEYAAIRSIAAKLGIATPETLRQWVRQAEVDAGQRPGGEQRGVGGDPAAAGRGQGTPASQ